jgi:hypothetical protein
MRSLRIALLAILAAACSGQSQDPDASVGDADGGNSRPVDADLGEDFGLLVPDNTTACPLGMGQELEDQLREKLRISFKPGLLVLPGDADTFEADLIQQIELTPGLGTPVPQGNGEFTRTVTGSLQDGTVEYSYAQDFRVGARLFAVAAVFRFEVAGGAAVAPLTTLDPRGMLTLLSLDHGWLTAGFSDGDPASMFLSCHTDPWRQNRYDFTLSNGDSLVLEEWMVEVPGWMMMCAAGLTRATWVRGADTRVVDDYWHRAYVPGNHNIIEFFAFRLDPPAGDVHGLKIYTQSLGMPLDELSSIFTLDADLAESGELDITGAAFQGVPCFMD